MKLYHGGLTAVEKPQIIAPITPRTVDFGNGFYTTTDIGQARRWVEIKCLRDNGKGGFVSIYEVDDDLLKSRDLKALIFESADRTWLDFVMSNRKNRNYNHDYDIVYGPVANDRVYATLTLFESDLLDTEETIRRLKTYKLVNQILFHSEKALSFLKYTGCEAVK